MSKKLALSSALSIMLMAGFVLFNGHTVAIGPDSADSSLAPAKAAMPHAPALPGLPILR